MVWGGEKVAKEVASMSSVDNNPLIYEFIDFMDGKDLLPARYSKIV